MRTPHDEYRLGLRQQAIELAHEMLASDDDLIVRCRKMSRLLTELNAPREQPYLIFVAVDSETDHLPLTVEPELLDPEYRLRCLKEAEEAGRFYRDGITEGCRAVLELFGDGER